jgi:hypothetical protein
LTFIKPDPEQRYFAQKTQESAYRAYCVAIEPAKGERKESYQQKECDRDRIDNQFIVFYVNPVKGINIKFPEQTGKQVIDKNCDRLDKIGHKPAEGTVWIKDSQNINTSEQ